jgi:hypothetical protein
MNMPASPLVWPEDYPPKNRWDSFFMGFPGLGPDLSFFKGLEEQQAARTEEVMAAWSDEQERRVALSLGQILRKHWGWKQPYFLPVDQTMVVVCGPDSSAFFEMDLADIFEDFNEQLGTRLTAGFWEVVIDWNDRNGCFGELVRKITTELKE